MNKTITGTVLALLTFFYALWVTPALAAYTISGYTASLLVTDQSGAVLGGDSGLKGYYSISLSGQPITGSYTGNLSGSFTLYDANLDGSRNMVNPTNSYSAQMADTFFLSNVNGVFTLGSTAAGVDTAMIQLGLGALAADPDYPTVVVQPAKNLGNGYFYVNQVYIDPETRTPYSFDELGLPIQPATSYGSILADAFTATDVNGNLIDMVIDDADPPAAVPIPSIFVLLGSGLASISFLRRRKA